MWQLIGAGISAYASIQAGKAKEDAARMDAFNTETEREQGEVLALQQAASRRYEYDVATKTNVAMFAASGRDIGSDRSVEAFLEKQKEIASKDLSRLSQQRNMEASARTREAMALRRGGKNARRASMLQATATMARGIQDAANTAK